MKIYLLLFLGIMTNAYAQDTIILAKYADGGSTIQVITAKDTVIYTYYSAKKLESKQFRDSETGMTRYIRYYRNGKTIWDKLVLNGIENGKCSFYSNQGNLVAELKFINGQINDTIFLKPNTHFLYGKIKSSSIVYGGMYRGEESVREEPSVVPYTRLSMKLVKLDSTIVNKNYKEFLFTTDHHGDFFVVIEAGQFGLFTKEYPLKDIYKGQYCPSRQAGGSWNSGWNLRSPILVDSESRINTAFFTNSFVGYAP